MWKTEDEKGFLMDRINQMQMKAFRLFSNSKHKKRMKILKFCIQTVDVYRKENIGSVPKSPKRMKIEFLTECLSQFCYEMYKRIYYHHNEKDENISSKQFSTQKLLQQFEKNIANKDWVDVALLAMMICNKKELMQEMTKIQFTTEGVISK